jgi:hypothetical protein
VPPKNGAPLDPAVYALCSEARLTAKTSTSSMTTHLLRALGLLLLAVNTTLFAAEAPGAKPLPPELAPVADESGLPRILIIGDSVSIAYTLAVRKELAGVANVHRPAANCGSTKTALGHYGLERWLEGDKANWDLIHFNHGLHDLSYRFPDDRDKNDQGEYASPLNGGRPNVSVADYEENLHKIVARLRKTGAKLVFGSTTPVPESDAAKYVKDSEQPYNEAAKRVMDSEGVVWNDLHAAVKPEQNRLQIPRNVHFEKAGSAVLATHVARAIRDNLPKK